jgi:hypothetical protein
MRTIMRPWKIMLALGLLCAPFASRADPLGSVAPGSTASRSDLVGCIYNATPTAAATGQQQALACDSSGHVIVSAAPYATVQTAINASSGNVANAAATATLTGTATTRVYISGFSCQMGGATAAAEALITVTGLIGGTETYVTGAPLGATVPPTILTRAFSPPVPASAVNTNIVVSQAAGGAGNANAACSAEGFYQ